MTWLFFLKIYDAKEEEWEFHDDSYESIIPDRLRWHSWLQTQKTATLLLAMSSWTSSTTTSLKRWRVSNLPRMHHCAKWS